MGDGTTMYDKLAELRAERERLENGIREISKGPHHAPLVHMQAYPGEVYKCPEWCLACKAASLLEFRRE
jgi:hypothetical protein